LKTKAVSLVVAVLVTIVLVVAIGVGAYLALAPGSTDSVTTNVGPFHHTNSISLQGFSLCARNCLYPTPYLSGNILINGSIPLSSVAMYVNGTFNG
jgi:hypothetical protein